MLTALDFDRTNLYVEWIFLQLHRTRQNCWNPTNRRHNNIPYSRYFIGYICGAIIKGNCQINVKCFSKLQTTQPDYCSDGGLWLSVCLPRQQYTLFKNKQPLTFIIREKCIYFHKIFWKFLEDTFPPVKKLNIFVTDDVMLTAYFLVCKLWVLPLNSEDRHLIKS